MKKNLPGAWTVARRPFALLLSLTLTLGLLICPVGAADATEDDTGSSTSTDAPPNDAAQDGSPDAQTPASEPDDTPQDDADSPAPDDPADQIVDDKGEVVLRYDAETGAPLTEADDPAVRELGELTVALQKEITRQTGADEFEVQLTVTVDGDQTATETESTTEVDIHSDPAAAVLVIDVSASMRECILCGRTRCGCENGRTRLEAVSESLAAFLDEYAASAVVEEGRDETVARYLSLVTFGSDGATALDWVDVSSDAGWETAQAALSRLEQLDVSPNWTNLSAGLDQALALLGKSTVTDIDNRHVLLFSDGAPTVGPTVRKDYKRIHEGTDEQADCYYDDFYREINTRIDALKTGGSEVRAIVFGASNVGHRTDKKESFTETNAEWLARTAPDAQGKDTGGHLGAENVITPDDLETLRAAFAGMVEVIEHRRTVTTDYAIDERTVIDYMGDDMRLILDSIATENGTAAVHGDDRPFIEWSLSDPVLNEDGSRSYFLIYRVRLDLGLTEEQLAALTDDERAELAARVYEVGSDETTWLQYTYLLSTTRDGQTETEETEGRALFATPLVRAFVAKPAPQPTPAPEPQPAPTPDNGDRGGSGGSSRPSKPTKPGQPTGDPAVLPDPPTEQLALPEVTPITTPQLLPEAVPEAAPAPAASLGALPRTGAPAPRPPFALLGGALGCLLCGALLLRRRAS